MKASHFVSCVLIVIADALLTELIDNLENGLQTVISPLDPVLFTTVCSDDLGCFNTGPPWYEIFDRPFSPPPIIPPGTVFQLYTPTNPGTAYPLQISVASLANSFYDDSLPTKVLIHGFATDLGLDLFRFVIKEALLYQGDYNVIIIDWTADNGLPYSQAVANTRTTGVYVANLINFLIDNTYTDASNFHIIGHSLGAHMAGYVGKRIPGIGRITGLDPAGPYFEGVVAQVRLDRSDANFVDIIHTSASSNIVGGLGINQPIGHMDFYPNSGDNQPGCSAVDLAAKAALGIDKNASSNIVPETCNHQKSNEFFIASINVTNCRFTGVLCKSYPKFLSNGCSYKNSMTSQMGYFVKQLSNLTFPAKFYLRTGDDFPYCSNIDKDNKLIN